MIGPNWLDARNESGKRRLSDPNDFVRIEIAAALQRDIPVIPVLLDGAKVPKSNRLPDELKELGSRNGIEVRHASFNSDIERLVRGLKGQSNLLGTPQIDTIAEVALAKGEASDSSRIKHASSQEHVVVVIHGIRDFALWQTNVRKALEGGGLKIELTNFMRLDLLRFLIPIPYFRRVAIEKIWKQIEDIRLIYPNAHVSLIAHSFGTYILAEILRRKFTFRAHRVIFCGSVVRYDFPFEQIKERFESPILNEVGTRDVWPAIAESVTWGYGSAGTYGFRRPRVRDRWHNGKNHSAFLNAEFCRKFWIPFLKDGTVVDGSVRPEPPRWWLRLLYILRIKYVAFALGIILIWAALPTGTLQVDGEARDPMSIGDLRDIPGFDAYGFDYEQIPDISYDACKQACASSGKCKALTYNSAHSLCFLKSRAQYLIATTDADAAVAGHLFDSLERLRIRALQRREIDGYDYSDRRDVSFFECLMQCENDIRCQAVSWVRSEKWCLFKSGVGREIYNRKVDSGVK